MLNNLKIILSKWCTDGMKFPFLHDPVKNAPSVTLLFFYLSYLLAFCVVLASSTLSLINEDYLTATFMPILMMFSGFIFYRLRRLDSVKIDLDDKSIDLKGGSEDLNK